MNLQIRDPRAHELARKLAVKRGISMTDAVIVALEAELNRDSEHTPLADKLAEISSELLGKAKQHQPDMTGDEIDAMWGHV